MDGFYDDLELSFAEARSVLEGGARDRRKSAHTPVVATLNSDGAPSQRVMILRHVDWNARTLRFHTDSRSIKVGEANHAPASVLIYDADAKVQLRLIGSAWTEQASAMADAAWGESTLFARRCYMAETAPGVGVAAPTSGLPASIEGIQPTEADIAPVRKNFAILLFRFDNIEWLYLANSGHRRARWSWRDGWQGSWLIP